MIRIERGEPPFAFEPGMAEGRLAARLFFQRPEKQRRQERFDFEAALKPAILYKHDTFQRFHGKCAYCETPVKGPVVTGVDKPNLRTAWSGGELDWFRPHSNARNLDGSTSPDHYWWLAFEWENLYATCAACNRAKKNLFPVEGARSSFADWKEGRIDREKRLLLDPCRDDPDQHLTFTSDGQVGPLSAQGEATIEILKLNRTPLIRERRRAVKRFEDYLRRRLEGRPARIKGPFGDKAPFAAACRQAVRVFFEKHPKAPKERLLFREWLGERLAARPRTAEVRRVRARVQKADLRSRQIEEIDIRNFRSIGRLKLAFRSPTDREEQTEERSASTLTNRAPWLTLLGENGTGKSSVLQAVALCLMGQKKRDALGPFGVRPRDVVRRMKNGKYTKAGHVKVRFIDEPEPVELHFDSGRFRFRGEPREPRVALLAYGSTRHLPRPGQQAPETRQALRVENLVNPFSPLIDAEKWLPELRRRDEEAFDYTARALKDILMLEQRARIDIEKGRAVVHTTGGKFAFRELSDGYRSMVAMTADIIRTLQSRYPVLESAEGLVLVDEIGAHLHPRWKMRIVGLMRYAFPHVQFLSTTHDPLCLRGLAAGEIAVMQTKRAGQVEALTDLPPVDGLRVDQLLTSEFFGLHTAMDPEIEEAFARYYDLLARPSLKKLEREELGDLEKRLADKDQLGSTPRQRLMLRSIDEYLAERAGAEPSPAVARRVARRLTRILLEGG